MLPTGRYAATLFQDVDGVGALVVGEAFGSLPLSKLLGFDNCWV